ncbi:MAG: DOPA 4,5-dioxygenase family protein [Myxococcota bacterium]
MPTSFHVHVYFRDDAEQANALALRRTLAERFPLARLGRVHPAPVAFHPAPMYQVGLDGVDLGTLIPWLQRHRDGLSLLVHPLTGNVVREHTEDAIWLGPALPLDELRLRSAASAASDTPLPEGPSILRLDASARRMGSRGRALADALVSRLIAAQPGVRVVQRDLADGVPLLDAEALDAWPIAPGARSDAETDAASVSDVLVAELESADAVVIALPIYNFHVPAAFKAWIDQVARSGRTFGYGPNGPVGLLADRPVYVVMTSGGTRLDGPLDFVTPWLKHVLGFLGLHDVTRIAADGLGRDEPGRLAEARAAIEQIPLPFRRIA